MTIGDAPPEPEMLEEYGHLEGWERNPFRFRRTVTVVSLEPDVSAVFRTSDDVNEALRTLIAEGRVPSKLSRG